MDELPREEYPGNDQQGVDREEGGIPVIPVPS